MKDKSVSLHCPWPESLQHQAIRQCGDVVIRHDVLSLVTLWIQLVIQVKIVPAPKQTFWTKQAYNIKIVI